MAMRNREDALLSAYLSNYRAAQASTVNSGRQATQSAQKKGSALLNASDKTLPALKDTYSDTLQNIVQENSLANSLNNDVLNRQMKLAQAQFDQANDLYEQQKKAQQYAEKQAQKAAKSSGRSSYGSSGTTTNSASYDAMTAAAQDLKASTSASSAGNSANIKQTKAQANASKTKPSERDQAERNSSARARYQNSAQFQQDKQDSKKLAAAREKDAAYFAKNRIPNTLRERQEAANAGANKGKPVGKTYAEQQGTGSAAVQPAQSHAASMAGNRIGSTTAAAGQAPSPAEKVAAKINRNDWKSRQEDTATALQRLQNDADYRAELGAPGRKLTQAEVQAVKQYNQTPKNLYEQVQAGDLSLDDYNKQGQALARMNQKASLNGLGQDLQAAAAGFMRSFPLENQIDSAMTDWADDQTGDKYSQARESGAVPGLLPTLDQ